MKVSEAIKILESKVVKSEENLKHFPKESQGYAANEARIIAYNIAINKLEQIEEPQAEKVEVPDYVAPFIEKLKTTGRRYGVELEKAYASGEDADLSEWLWFNENVLTVFKALENGYTVKKESRWVVKDSDGEFIYDLHLCGVDTTTFSSNTTKFDVLTFRDRDKAEAVATLVEGSVEEI